MPRYLHLFSGGDSPLRARSAIAVAEQLASALGLLAAPCAPPHRASGASASNSNSISGDGEPDLLPPPRALALQLGVSPRTVAAAYRALEERALVVRVGQSFAPANRAVPSLPRTLARPPAMKPVVAANRPARGTPGFITLSSAFLDPRLAPTEEINRCVRLALRSPGLSTYAHVQGYLPLRQLIAARLRARGIPATPEHIVTTVGSQQVLELVCRSLSIRRVATEDPAYLAARALFAQSDLDVTALPVDPFTGLDPARWRHLLATRQPALAYLTSSFQNPTGYSYSSRELHQILAWSHELGFGLLEDDWASEMMPHAEARPTLRSLGGEGVLYMNAFTKKTLPSLRVGFVACDEHTLPALVQAKKLAINGSPALLEEALCELIADGSYDAHLQKVQRELAARYLHCLAALRSLLPAQTRWTLPGGGPLLWLELPSQISVEAVIAELAQHGVLVNSQREAFAGAPHLHGFMIGYAFPDPDEMTRAIETLAAVMKRHLRAARGARRDL